MQVAIFNAAMFCHTFCHILCDDKFSQQRIGHRFTKPKAADHKQAIFCLLENMCHFRMLDQIIERTNTGTDNLRNIVLLHCLFGKAKLFRGQFAKAFSCRQFAQQGIGYLAQTQA